MIDFLRNLTQSAEEKRQEQLHAYISNALSANERLRFEVLLAEDAALQAEVEGLRQMRENMRQLPKRRVPRNFVLDPALYTRPQRQPLGQYYPMVRVATVMTAVFLVIAVGAEFLSQPNQLFVANQAPEAAMEAESVAMESAAPEAESEEIGLAGSAADTAADSTAEEAVAEESADAELLTFDPTTAVEPVATPAAAPTIETQLESEDAAMAQPAEEEAAPAPLATPELDTPRIVATEPIDDRMADDGGSDSDSTLERESPPVVLDEPALENEIPEETAVLRDNFEPTPAETPLLSPLRLAQIGLTIILVGLLMLLQAARRQR